ncbi:protein kinase domain-containing protein [Pseudofrankia inefficax]|uniref:non-specific serine/threonine protein kinase n=1 Tax=Pseudofrankia inefficax (strain DSM 45817 / CECT 9037 / DDB 130130 / EuI1c) TaxID=298654 RepID=E3IVK5_PSEI1|nr:caspase family protein [Pseudofrankia inefficax]ADP82511.1 serine/threonine protein kinase [Pseudofrankia inefficax]
MSRHAIVVGVDAYPEFPLEGCVNDATDIATCLEIENYGFTVTLLTDGDATRDNVKDALGERTYEGDGGDFLLFYFAGHGVGFGDAGYLVTIDEKRFEPGISLSELSRFMDAASSRYNHVIAILDCCHSGLVFNEAGRRPLTGSDIDQEIPTINESRCVLAACRGHEEAQEIDGHGVFTAALLDGLLGDAVGYHGEVSLLRLAEYAFNAVPASMQTPVFKGDVTGTVILGVGFPERMGPPIGRNELEMTLAKAQAFVDEHYNLQQTEFRNRERKLRSGVKVCASDLEGKIRWFRDTETALPDLLRDPTWSALQARMSDFQKVLAGIEPTMRTVHGLVTDRIGQGGYGQVWRARRDDGETVALKIFHGNELGDETKVKRFRRGFDAMRMLEHPRIVNVRDLTYAPYAFTMDYIDGNDLRKTYFEDDPSIVLRLLVEIAETVQYAHSRKILHRDIKPENIIVVLEGDDLRPVPYLTDFDLAYHETNRTATSEMVGGVLNYAPPEQITQPNAAAARAATVDIYSLAQLMFFIIVRADPRAYDIQTNLRELTKKLNSWTDDQAAEPLVELYRRATDADPSKRPQSMVEVATLLTRSQARVMAMSGNDAIPEDEFCRRIAMLSVGLGKFTATNREASFSSLSGQVSVVVRLKSVEVSRNGHELPVLEIEFAVTDKIPVPSLKSGSAGRQAINNRLLKIIRRFPNVSHMPGSKGSYQVFINVKGLPFSIGGATDARHIVGEIIAGIEAWG